VPVELVPIAGAEIGEEEAVVPVAETEVVVSKWAAVKEEARVCKAVVEGTEALEEDVRRQEIDVEDETAEEGKDKCPRGAAETKQRLADQHHDRGG
jgi:uncharacterized protein (TIGR02271 family)